MPGLPGSFRFTALPAEIRNKIYRDLLCTFKCDREPDGRFDSVLARLMREKEMLNGVCEAALNGNASILLASRQVYREAYDVMVKTNQFVRVRGHNFNFSELLLRGQLPVVTMDRARSAQFQGYMLCMDITDAEEFANDSSAVRFDFMILGRHWDALCLSISHLYAALPDFSFHLAFDPASMTAQKALKATVDGAFLVQTQDTLLNSFKAHFRGIHSLQIDGLINTELSESIKREVAQRPFDNIDTWCLRLIDKCQFGNHLLEHKKTIESSVVWTNILGELSWVWEEIQYTKDRDRSYQISYICQLGEARCFLHHLEFPPADYTDSWLETMNDHLMVVIQSIDHTVAKIRSAASTPKAQGDVMGARVLILLCRTVRLKTIRSRQPMPLSTTQELALHLTTASQLAPNDRELAEEIQGLFEISGLEGLTLDDIANAL